jgi:Tol biopolymer transport system component
VDPFTPHWGTQDEIVFGGPTGIFRIAATGGTPVLVSGVGGRFAFLLPDGDGLLYNLTGGGGVALYDLERDTSFLLIPGGRAATYVPTGHLLYNAPDGGLFAVAFDLRRRRVQGAPARVLERVGGTTLTRGYAVSATGVLVQHDAEGSMTGGINRLVVVDPGRGTDTVRLPPGRRLSPRFSRDGRWLAMEVVADARNGQTDIYTLDLVTGTYTQLTFDGDNDQPVWSPDGRRIAFDRVATRPSGEDLFIKPVDNSGAERRLTTLGSAEIRAAQWDNDGTLVFDAVVSGRATDILLVSADSGSTPNVYLSSPFQEGEPQVSPDRRLLVFTANETGSEQVWMRDFPVPQGKWNVSRGQARTPRWSPDGRFVYFWRSGTPLDTLMRARIDRTPGIVVHAPEVVVTMDASGTQNWDLHPDGRRFVVAIAAADVGATSSAASPTRYLIMQNWFGELRRLTGARSR